MDTHYTHAYVHMSLTLLNKINIKMFYGMIGSSAIRHIFFNLTAIVFERFDSGKEWSSTVSTCSMKFQIKIIYSPGQMLLQFYTYVYVWKEMVFLGAILTRFRISLPVRWRMSQNAPSSYPSLAFRTRRRRWRGVTRRTNRCRMSRKRHKSTRTGRV